MKYEEEIAAALKKNKELQMLTQIYNKGSMANSRSGDKFRPFEYNFLFQVCYWEHKKYNWSSCYGGLFYQLTR